MPPMIVAVAEVTVDRKFPEQRRTRYRIRMECGCEYWEEHDQDAPPPEIGRPVPCHASHQTRTHSV